MHQREVQIGPTYCVKTEQTQTSHLGVVMMNTLELLLKSSFQRLHRLVMLAILTLYILHNIS